jgi:hypothetical protein
VRTIRLAQVAVEAEVLRWRCIGARLALRLLFAGVALFFAAGAVVFAHVAGWVMLTQWGGRTQVSAAWILAGADAVVTIVFAFLATRSSPGRAELEALELRRGAIQGIGAGFDNIRLVALLVRLFNTMRRGSKD